MQVPLAIAIASSSVSKRKRRATGPKGFFASKLHVGRGAGQHGRSCRHTGCLPAGSGFAVTICAPRATARPRHGG